MSQPGPRRAPAPTPTGQAPAEHGNSAAVPADFFGPDFWQRVRDIVRAELGASQTPAELRLAAGYRTVVALAAAAHVPRAMLSRYEQRGSRSPGGRGANLQAIAECLGTTPAAYAASVRKQWELEGRGRRGSGAE